LITINELKIIKIKNRGQLHENSYHWMSWSILTKQFLAYNHCLYVDENNQVYSASEPPTMFSTPYIEDENECLALLCQFYGNDAWHNFFMGYRMSENSENKESLKLYYEFPDVVIHVSKTIEGSDATIIKPISEVIDDNYKILLVQMWELTLTNLEKKLYMDMIDILFKQNKKFLYFDPVFYDKSIENFDQVLEELFFKLQFDSDEYDGQSPVFDYELNDNNQYRVVLSKEAKQFFSKQCIDKYF